MCRVEIGESSEEKRHGDCRMELELVRVMDEVSLLLREIPGEGS